jgi:ceramide glucosyltransferase
MLIAWLLAGVTLLWAVLLTLRVYEHKRYVRVCLRTAPRPWHAPPQVLVCVPCKGLELDLASNLRCVLSQNYPNFRVRFVVESATDPAHAEIQRLIATSSVPCELLVAGTCTDSGQKVHNLRCATAELPDAAQVLAFFDSDARPAPDALARMVDRVCRSGLQVVTGYRWFVPQRTNLASLMLASVNASVASLFNRKSWNLVWGGSWAVTRELFEKTALSEAWRGTLSDDLVATRVMRSAGAKVAFEPGCMAASPIDVNWREAASFLRRQFLIGRCYAPYWWWATLPLMVIQPVVLVGGLTLATYLAWQGNAFWFSPLLVSASVYAMASLRATWRQAAWSSRMISAADVLRASVRFDRCAAPWSCVFAASIMLASAIGRSITWRGICYHIGPAGRITLLGRRLDSEQRRKMIAEQTRQVRRDAGARRAAGSTIQVATSHRSADSPRELELMTRPAPPERAA